MTKYFITGATGFVGRHFLESDSKNCFDLGITDLLDFEHIIDRVKTIELNSNIVHLAAQSHVGKSFKSPELTYEINVNGTYNLIKALVKINFSGRVLLVSSGDVYGSQSEVEMPITEKSELRPQSPYAASKIMAEFMSFAESAGSDFNVLYARSFNHIGPLQNESFVVASFAKQLVEISLEKEKGSIEVGNLETYRDFTHVSDIIDAYKIILKFGIAGERYNVASGISSSIGTVLNTLKNIVGVDPSIITDSNLIRKNDQAKVCVSIDKILSLGWKPKFKLEEALKDVVEYWIDELEV